MQMTTNKKDYWEFIRQLKNDPIARKNSGHAHIISVSEHENYMNSYGHQYYICLDESRPIGYVGHNATNYISVAVISSYRGKGVGKFMLNYIKERPPLTSAKAVVRMDNEASIKLFESCGFTKKYYIFEGDTDD